MNILSTAENHLENELNPIQLRVVLAPLGNTLVIAGAGSGKTRVLVHRISSLIRDHNVSPYSLMAVTFTNKAAHEMKSRLEHLLNRNISGLWIGTFHGLSHRFLRMHWNEAGLSENFQVIDSDDQLQIIRKIFKKLSINEERWEPKKAQNFINRKKDEGLRFNQLLPGFTPYDKIMSEIYSHYEQHCQAHYLLDFAELLLKAYEVLQSNKALCEQYQDRFKHFLVDEFQDTNKIQYQWLRKLSEKSESVMVVGDDDQSIYGWRGAQIENIYRFEKDFEPVEVIRLEQNYRSTSTILSAANALIMHNDGRMGKTLWTAGETGELIHLYGGFNEEDEALYIVRQIKAWLENNGTPQEIGILYRSNAQSRVIEEALVRAGIPYRIYGGLRFFERSEIKDALAYLRLAVNADDNLCIERVVNMPPRGIGDKSIEKIKNIAQEKQCSLWQAIQFALETGIMSGKAKMGLQEFYNIIENLNAKINSVSLAKLVSDTIQESGLLKYFKEQKGERSQSRAENLEELVNATADFEPDYPEDSQTPLLGFLAYTALEAGQRGDNDSTNAVQMMTIHSAKGLEFPLVFIAGLEEGLFPHHFSQENPAMIEEERRLCYVGVTRAMKQLYLCYAEKRRLFGRDEERAPSRFIREIPRELMNEQARRLNVTKSWLAPRLFESDKISKSPIHETPFYLGQRVTHPKFGVGIVVDYEGSGDRTRLHIHFEVHGNKWLALSFAQLTAVD